MRNLVLVSSIKDVPSKFKSMVYVVTVNTWEEFILFMSGKRSDVVVFWGEGVPVERLLKAVESYEGNLLVYSEVEVDPVMRSRFTRVLRGKQNVRWVSVGKKSSEEELLCRVKNLMGC